MNRKLRFTAPLALLLLLAAPLAARATSTKGTIYLATLVDTVHVLPFAASVPIRIRLDRFTTDRQAEHLAAVARSKGEIALRTALGHEFLGNLEVNGRIADPIAYARTFHDAQGTHVLLIAQRPLSMREIFAGWPTADYPFTVLQLDLRSDGTGSGSLIAAARIRPRKSGEIELLDFNFIPSRLFQVKTLGS